VRGHRDPSGGLAAAGARGGARPLAFCRSDRDQIAGGAASSALGGGTLWLRRLRPNWRSFSTAGLTSASDAGDARETGPVQTMDGLAAPAPSAGSAWSGRSGVWNVHSNFFVGGVLRLRAAGVARRAAAGAGVARGSAPSTAESGRRLPVMNVVSTRGIA